MENKNTAEHYMRRAIKLALKGKGFTHPNPLVGAVIVKDGRVIGEGYHEMYGELHAERNALLHCTEDPKGATVYVTLEPCCHHGKQPPCTEALIEAGVAEVVTGSDDPNPLVAGKGIEQLESHGIKVTRNLLKDECDAINKVFFHYITTGMPFVTLKYAMTIDGKIASATGKSKWISCEESRKYVHELRADNMAIMAGIGTVLADDPMLNVRGTSGFSPVRVICDTNLRTPIDSNVVETAGSYRDYLPKTIIATAVTDETRLAPYIEKGVHILNIDTGADGHIDMKCLFTKLGKMGIDSVLVEGGASINWAVLSAGLANHACCFIAPMIMGGETAKSPVGGIGADSPDDAARLENTETRTIGTDLLVEGDL